MRLLFVLAVCGMLPLSAYSQSDTLEIVLSNYFKHYKAPNFNPTGVCKLTDCTVNEENKTIDINTNDVLTFLVNYCIKCNCCFTCLSVANNQFTLTSADRCQRINSSQTCL